jgi:hypothetical protein
MDVQNGPQSGENSHKCSIGINITERRMLVSFGCVCVQAPLGCRAQEDKLAPALPPRAGAVALQSDSKNPCTEGAGVSNAEKFWESITRAQPSRVAACCLVNREQDGDSSDRIVSFDSKAVLIRIIERANFRSSGWIVVRQTATGERTSLAPARQAWPVNATLGTLCAAPQHRVATITGRRGFRPGGLVASGDHPPFCKPRPPEVDTAKSRRHTFRTVFRCTGRGEGEPTVQPKCVFTGGSSIARMPEKHG